jgi:MATE family multidrug resistance protein
VFARWAWPRWRAQWQLVALGVPIGAAFFVDVTAFTFMALFIARFGALYSGAHQIAANVAALAFMLPLAIGSAAAVLVGQALGADARQRARTTGITALAIGLGCGLAVGASVFLAADPLVRLYTSDAAVRRLAATLLAFVAVYHVFDAVQIVVVSVLRGYRHAVVPMLIFGVALWGVGLGGGYAIGTAGVGVGAPLAASGFWLAGVVGMALAATLVTAYFLKVSRGG